MSLLCACAAPPRPAPPPPPPPAEPTFPHVLVWTRESGVELRRDGTSHELRLPFTRLDVLSPDTSELVVLCGVCPDSVQGRVQLADVVYTPQPLHVAAWQELADFALALRHATLREDTAALRAVMVPDFVFSFVGEQSADRALIAWTAERLQTLHEVPALLDQGLATRDSALWVAPPDFLERPGYHGLRLGFRRSPTGDWRWLFLIRGEGVG